MLVSVLLLCVVDYGNEHSNVKKRKRLASTMLQQDFTHGEKTTNHDLGFFKGKQFWALGSVS